MNIRKVQKLGLLAGVIGRKLKEAFGSGVLVQHSQRPEVMRLAKYAYQSSKKQKAIKIRT